ncbi:AMP-binding protein [Ilyobacter polytropus]|uniref:AMP-dependent synthetase and ligase n=1 Tax=Ilyobacter polytropus (strain ATCC 51220 / DSM 2926 / LMG 16218 / CuHBu1) TaxID=572544 RepID=E3HC91_ILYPC|nr:AMP-binding protein [Ilyobacter polytropus]ADO83934.1 AMP-dependent synthetase and ligase [Ilyobacter polytropus DSM 2926]
MEFIRDFEKSAIIYEGKEISYSDIISAAKFISEDIDICKGDRVMIFMENRPEYIYSFLGVWDRSGICVCIDASFDEKEFSYYLNDSAPKCVFVSNETITAATKACQISGLDTQLINVDEIKINYNFTKEKLLKSPERNDVSLILYTSGTTGNPKGVMLTMDNILLNIESLDKYNMFRESDVILGILPLHHIFPLLGVGVLPLYKGSTIVFLKDISSQGIKNSLKEHKITIILGVPRLWEMFHKGIMGKINSSKAAKLLFKLSKKLKNEKFSRMIFRKVHEEFGGNIRFLVSGGSKLDAHLTEDFTAMGMRICEGYGMTETAPMIAFNPDTEIIPGSAGKILPGINVKTSEDGEILVKGRNVMRGYYNKPKETSQVIDSKGWLHTGDLGYLKKDIIFVTGRKKEMIVLSNGKNINPIEIEKQLMENTDIIQEVALVENNKILTAVIYPDFNLISAQGINNIKETLKWGAVDKYNIQAPSYKKILDIKIVKQELPKTKLGKIRRFKISELLKENTKIEVEIKEPNFQQYKLLKKFLSEIKNISVFPDSHLELDLGLDSLDMVEVLAYIESSFGVRCDEKTISENPTLEKLSYYLKENSGELNEKQFNWSEILNKKVDIELPKSNIVGSAMKKILKLLFMSRLNLKKETLENIPREPCIFVGNHQSFIDGFILNEALPGKILKKTYYMAKVKHFKSPIMKILGKNANILVVDINKNLSESLQLIAQALKKGKNIVIFPEGIRSRDGKIGEFKKSFAIIAKELNIPIAPFGIKGAYEAFPTGAKIPKSGKLHIKFFDKIYPGKLNYDEISSKVMDEIKDWVEG